MSAEQATLGDYQHAIDEIRRCLHDPRGSKVAVMIGAGFSRNANPVGKHGRRFPLWHELTRILAERLYPDADERDDVVKKIGATSAALRLAQEFQAAFGRAALIQLVRDTIRDDEFEPGTLHGSLMQLPWSDVFTTNYDTLLEDAAKKVWERKYDLVGSVVDLAIAERPRIVKLHGSLPGLRDLVLTEEDYRRYPIEHAPFVNAIRASLAENVFCLIGFSGDDPNFLAWEGWVRDELDDYSPFVYLFAGNELKPFQRRLLEDRRVIPIPIKKMSGKRDFSDAYQWLFEQLRQPLGTPTARWNIGPRYVTTAPDRSVSEEPLAPSNGEPKMWIDAALRWRENRLQYKGWHILYREGIERLWNRTQFWLGQANREVAEQWSPPEAMLILRELTWRCAKALVPLPDDRVSNVLDPAIAGYDEWRADKKDEKEHVRLGTEETEISVSELDTAGLSIHLELLRHARETGNTERFERLLTEIDRLLREDTFSGTADARHFIEHQRILRLLANLDHEEARARLRKWDTSSAEPIWEVRRAGLCLECGLRKDGEHLLCQLLASFRQRPLSRDPDIQMLSTEGLALFLHFCVERSSRLFNEPSSVATDSVPQPDSIRALQDPIRPDKPENKKPVQHKGETREERETLERLNGLQRYGYDPYQVLDWLTLLNAAEPAQPRERGIERESFDIGRIQRTYGAGDPERQWHAYRAVRFIEEAGLPLRIGRGSSLIVAATLFRDASRTIANFAPNEAIGLVLRSADSKLLEEFLSRKCIALLTEEQVHFLSSAGRSAMRQALAHLGPPPTPRETQDSWWESQFKAACVVLGRAVVRLKDEQLVDLLKHLLDLQHDSRIRARVNGPLELAVLIRRASESLSANALSGVLPKLAATPVLGSDAIPKKSQRLRGDWHDPIEAVAVHPSGSLRPTTVDIHAEVTSLIAHVRGQTGLWRKSAASRLATLHSAGLLSVEEQREFVQALFVQTDKYGLPSDTGCYDSLVLTLPRVRGVAEKQLFRSKYIQSSEQPGNYWREVQRTANRFGEPRASRARSVDWTRRDLDVILERAEGWLERSLAGSESPPLSQHAFRRAASEEDPDYASWLETVEQVVLLAPKATEADRDRVVPLLDRADEAGRTTARVVSTLCCLGMLDELTTVSRIQRALGSRKDSGVLQACFAIARWCQHTRNEREPVIPSDLLSALSLAIATRRHEKLSLLINTAKDVVEILDVSQIPSAFVENITSALDALLDETRYQSKESPFTMETRIRLRLACARIARTLLERGHDSNTIRSWVALASEDLFPEVRREVQ